MNGLIQTLRQIDPPKAIGLIIEAVILAIAIALVNTNICLGPLVVILAIFFFPQMAHLFMD
jgi:hypothetical protein